MSYHFETTNILQDEHIEPLTASRLVKVAQSIFSSGLTSQEQVLNAPPIPLRARIMSVNAGLSGDAVFEIIFEEINTKKQVGRYILKVFSDHEKMKREQDLRSLAANTASEHVSFRVIPQVADPLILAGFHAATELGSDTRALHEYVKDLLERPDKTSCDILCRQIRVAGSNIRSFCERAAAVLHLSPNSNRNLYDYLHAFAYRFPPDIIVDLKGRTYREKYFPNNDGITFSSAEGLFPGDTHLEKSYTKFSSWASQKTTGSKWNSFSGFQFRRKMRGGYYEYVESRPNAQQFRVWIRFPEAVPENEGEFFITPELVTQLNLKPDALSFRTVYDELTRLGFSDSANRPLFEVLPKDKPIDLILEHADLHCNNFLVSKEGSVKIIDLDVQYCLPGTMAARLETSLWLELDLILDRLSIGPELAEIFKTIESDDPRHDDPVFEEDKVRYILSHLVRSIREGFLGKRSVELPAFTFQCLNYQKNVIQKGGAVTAPFASYVGYIFSRRHIRESSSQVNSASFISDDSAESYGGGLTIRDLWRKAIGLFGGEEDELGEQGQEFLKQLESSSPGLFNSTLTDLQQSVLDYSGDVFRENEHVVLCGPTSSGKSTLIELFLARPALLNGNRRCAVYIAPTRSLTRAKFEELRSRLKGTSLYDHILMSTGEERDDDWKIQHGKFRIVCMVYEKANMLLSMNPMLVERIGCVVVDELHMLTDIERGPILELALTKLAEHRNEQHVESVTKLEDLLRIVCVTTESGGLNGVLRFLSTTASQPLVFTSLVRPVNVSHHVLLPASDNNKPMCTIETVAVFEGGAKRELERPALLNLINRFAKYGLRMEKQKDEECFLHFIKSKLELYPTGYRALVFVPGKEDATRMGQRLKNIWKRRTENESLSSLRAHLDSSEDPKARGLVELMQHSIFIHHADLEKDLRNIIEDIAAKNDPDADSQVVFCTETLSYGVNLAINDVFIYGVDFYAQSRRRTPKLMPLSSHSFHNMAGRAGRLGKVGAAGSNVYIMVRDGVDPVRVIKLYYGPYEEVISKIYVGDDEQAYKDKVNGVMYRAFNKAFVKSSDVDGPDVDYFQLIDVKDFTYPFTRSVLDTLRYLNVRKNFGDPIPVSADDVAIFLAKTIYGKALTPEKAEEAMVFYRCVRRVLEACTDPNLGLTKSAGGKFMITDRGQSIIDTGTELTTIEPAWKLIRSLHTAWKKHNDVASERSFFPSELYLLVILTVPEVCRRYLMNTPECRGDSTWNDEIILLNREEVKTKFAELCSRYLSIFDDDLINGVVEAIERDTEVDTPQPHYEHGRADGMIRTFCALLAWINFAEQSEVIRIFEKSANPQSKGMLTNFRSLLDMLNWKMLFLNILLRFPGDPDVSYTYESARKLRSIAERIRLGCTEIAVPLFWPTKESRVKRTEARLMIESGHTPQRLMKIPNEQLNIGIIRPEQTSTLIGNISKYVIDQYSALVHELKLDSNHPDVDRRSIVYKLASNSISYFKTAVSLFRRSSDSINPVPSGFDEFLRYELCPLSDGGSISSSDTVRADLFSLKVRCENESLFLISESLKTREESMELAFDRSETWKVVGVHVAYNGKCYVDSGKWVHISSIVDEMRAEDNLVFVVIPWLPQAVGDEVESIIRERRGSGLITSFVTLPCFILMLAMVIRNYTSGKHFFDLLQDRESTGAIGVQEFYNYYLSNRGNKMIASIEEKLISYFEVV